MSTDRKITALLLAAVAAAVLLLMAQGDPCDDVADGDACSQHLPER